MWKTLILTAVIAFLLFEVLEHVLMLLFATLSSRRKQAISGPEALVGRRVEVRRWEETMGVVTVRGELWQAFCRTPLQPGDQAIIRRVQGLKLEVEPLEETAGEAPAAGI